MAAIKGKEMPGGRFGLPASRTEAETRGAFQEALATLTQQGVAEQEPAAIGGAAPDAGRAMPAEPGACENGARPAPGPLSSSFSERTVLLNDFTSDEAQSQGESPAACLPYRNEAGPQFTVATTRAHAAKLQRHTPSKPEEKDGAAGELVRTGSGAGTCDAALQVLPASSAIVEIYSALQPLDASPQRAALSPGPALVQATPLASRGTGPGECRAPGEQRAVGAITSDPAESQHVELQSDLAEASATALTQKGQAAIEEPQAVPAGLCSATPVKDGNALASVGLGRSGPSIRPETKNVGSKGKETLRSPASTGIKGKAERADQSQEHELPAAEQTGTLAAASILHAGATLAGKAGVDGGGTGVAQFTIGTGASSAPAATDCGVLAPVVTAETTTGETQRAAGRQVEVGIQDPALGEVRVQAMLDRNGVVHIEVGGKPQGTDAVLEQIAPLMHVAVLQQAEMRGQAHTVHLTASAFPMQAARGAGDPTPGSGAHGVAQSGSFSSSLLSDGQSRQQQPRPQPSIYSSRGTPPEAEEPALMVARTTAGLVHAMGHSGLSVRI